MEIRASMVEYALMRRGHDVRLSGNGDLPVARVRSHRAGGREAGTLYVADAAHAVPKPPANAGFAILVFNGESNSDEPGSASGSASGSVGDLSPSERETHAAGALKTGKPRSGAGESSPCADPVVETYDALRELDTWDASLNEALLRGATLERFIQLGREMLGCPLAYFDRNLIVLAASDDYWDRGSAYFEADTGLNVEGQMPSNRAAELVEDLDYLHAADIHGGFYYEGSRGRMYYGINTFDHEDYLARLVLALPEGESRLHRGQELLIARYHARLDDLHLRYGGNASVVASQNDPLHALARRALLGEGGEQPAPEEVPVTLEAFNWSPDDDFVTAHLVFFEGLHWDTVSLYLCGLVERALAGSCAFPVDQRIVWLVDLTRAAQPGESRKQVLQRFTETLVSVLRNYACKAGISDVFEDFADARSSYKQAVAALDIGQVRDPHYWYYAFRDYAFDYLLAKCAEDLAPAQVCHPALEKLLAFDAGHGTEYARTLVCFLRNSQNTTHAAAELYIHRTSFMRRMAHIVELTGVNLDDPNQVLHLLLSAKLLGM